MSDQEKPIRKCAAYPLATAATIHDEGPSIFMKAVLVGYQAMMNDTDPSLDRDHNHEIQVAKHSIWYAETLMDAVEHFDENGDLDEFEQE